MNTLFKNNDERKIRRCDRNIKNAMQIPIDIYQNKLLQFNPKTRVNWSLQIIHG